MHKAPFKHFKAKEELLYLIIWLVVFLFPLVVGYTHTTSAEAARGFGLTREVTVLWRFQLIFLVCFILHDHLLAPRLVYGGRRPFYSLWTLALLLLFTVAHSLVTRVTFRELSDRPHRGETRFSRPPEPRGEDDAPFGPRLEHRTDRPPLTERGTDEPSPRNKHLGNRHPHDRHPRGRRPQRKGSPPFLFFFFVTPHEISALFTMSLLLGLNLAVKYTFKSDEERKRISDLERSNLEQQLKYLKYQINPHFFMNTLNNIHALVDINPEEAKHTVLILSKMMRYVLYDGERPLITLRKEADFISHYVQLMRIRYADNVDILFTADAELPEAQVPPLLLITFVENAFKHGVSASHPSYVHIALHADAAARRFTFSVSNSLRPAPPATEAPRQAAMQSDRQGGVGLKNALERLRLIYPAAFDYRPQSTANRYTVSLELPFQPALPQ